MTEFAVGLFCSVLFLGLSFAINRRLRHGPLAFDPYRALLMASAVFALAVPLEALVDGFYATARGQLLWRYDILPRHGGSVSALGALIWPAYGLHLYWLLQVLEQRLPEGWRGRLLQALIIGLDAPLFFEVTGNLLFLAITGRYYAYYLPGELWHLTSWQVVPIYMLCLFLGLTILQRLLAMRPRALLPPGLYLAGLGFVWLG
ncbi:hypothetical protein QVG61_05365 [Thiohalobacter sp. IOR34]|uniref:hypothetical protein n=1 Tax=Thiohalobacter sp. IOR34 TaxID=3057176 RepID=UPI0025B01A7D|nr:hypothetical protein [Thiohalobacter sp. IOR34]WJW76519.1 hypothetical protein QVG61_05365 [Thiohalobacter sp. IOR34]